MIKEGGTFNLITIFRSTFFYNILIAPCMMQFYRPYWETILLHLITLCNILIGPCFMRFCRPYVGDTMFKRKSKTGQVYCPPSGCNYKGWRDQWCVC